MKKNFFIVKKLLVMFFVISNTYVCGMEDNQIIFFSRSMGGYKSDIGNANLKNSKENLEKSIAAAEHNSKNIFLSLPNEIVYSILAYSVDTTKPLEDIMKSSLLLSTTCKKANTPELFIAIGKVCSSYDIAEKNSVMKRLLSNTNDFNYKNVRHGLFLLTYAGADNNADERYTLLSRAIHREDKQMIIALFQNNVNPNQQKKYEDPDFFDIKTVEILQMFIDQGVNLNAEGHYNPNLLWSCITHGRSSDLIEFYLNHKVDAKKIKIGNNECIFHHLARCNYSYRNIENYINLSTLLLKAAPDIINTLNQKGQTAMDIIKEIMKEEKQKTNIYKACIALAELFEKHGGKTAQQLKQDEQKRKQELRGAQSENNEHSDCIICFDKSDAMRHIPCAQGHPDRICVGCYDLLLKSSNNCPLCRTALS